jgi:glycosyltransferase involved in cell wall biosynthesis
LGLHGKKVLLFIGRFTANKRIDFLLEAFNQLRQTDDRFHLLLVGSGGEAYLTKGLEDITYFGPIVDLERLGPLYIASDLFAFPGSVGLGPLQALCYDLPVITIDSPTHMPEFEYLTPMNSVMLEAAATPATYAKIIMDLIRDEDRLAELKAGTWPSINHLTIEQMARNFIDGINAILEV